MIKNRRAFIVGIKSLQLSKSEIYFLKRYKPWGVILFLRNINSIKQTKNLTDNIRKIFRDSFYITRKRSVTNYIARSFNS